MNCSLPRLTEGTGIPSTHRSAAFEHSSLSEIHSEKLCHIAPPFRKGVLHCAAIPNGVLQCAAGHRQLRFLDNFFQLFKEVIVDSGSATIQLA